MPRYHHTNSVGSKMGRHIVPVNETFDYKTAIQMVIEYKLDPKYEKKQRITISYC